MKTQWLLSIVACFLFVGSAFPQRTFTVKLTANVPFDFVVNDTVLVKGDYVVSTRDDGTWLFIQNKTRPEYSAYVHNTDVFSPRFLDKEGQLIFIRTNGQHVLHQIALRGDNHIHDVIHHGHDPIELVARR